MWQKFRKREEAIKAYYKDKGEPARDHLPRTAVDGVISWEPVSMHWNIILSLHLETMPCWVWLQVCQRKERSCQDVIIPPHPTPPNLETMPCWVWLQVCQRKEHNCQDVIIPPHPTPPHLETMPCWVWPQVCQRKERSCQDVIIPPHRTPPTPPHSPASGDDAMLSVAASVSEEGTQLPGRYYPTPPPCIWRRCHVECGCKCDRGRNAPPRTLLSHPTPPHLETMPCWVWPQVCQRKERSCQDVIIPPHPTPLPRIWRRCHVECGRKCVRGRNAAARTLLSHPTPPPRIWRRCHVECGCKCDRGRNAPPRTLLSHPTPPHLETMPCWVWPQVCQRKERSCQDVIIPPHPTPLSRIWRRCHVECGRKCVRGRNAVARTLLSHPTPTRIWRRCYVDCGRNCDADVGFWVVRMVVGEWPFFGCEILLFWLRNRLFLVAESPFFGCEIK